MRVCTLASSSKGNCTVVWNDSTCLLIDCGICCSQLEEKLQYLSIDPHSVQALLITHEHSDHISGAKNFLKKYPTVHVYVYQPAYTTIVQKLDTIASDRILPFCKAGFMIGSLLIESFPVFHDAVACVGYSIYEGDQKMSILTDSGIITKDLLMRLYGSKLVILESNYDETMLWNNPEYPTYLKARIDSEHGHLSNEWASHAVCDLVEHGVKQIVLAHLSEKNNTPELAKSFSVKECEKKGFIENVHYLLDVAPASTLSSIYYLHKK